MFKKIFSKTTKKAEEGIAKAEQTLTKVDEAFANINSVATEMKKAMVGIKTLIMISTIGVILGITADIVSIAVSGRTIKIIKR